ncbi:MAG TPA: DUF6600 domain-containing protein [Myxococcales bacterium]|jgi:hypothetical protein|nr:DUF6600 domain-containing protein [Myxococcales bacterium]
MRRKGLVLAAVGVAALSGCMMTVRTVRPGAGWVIYGRSTPAVAAVSVRPRAVSFTAFYDALGPDGEWLVLPPYGHVWHPHAWVVGADFMPYSTGGTWVWTDVGWQFEGEWSWSWATFHYGRWLYHGTWGWVWVPGTVWGPAWVEWRVRGGYVGWAPLGPAGVVAVTAPGWSFAEAHTFGRRPGVVGGKRR